jgi:uncharacterized protein YrrD
MTDAETPIAWPALKKGVPVYSSDGEELGKVASVVADEQKDIFSGLTLDPGVFKHQRFVPAELVEQMTTGGVRLSLPSAEAEQRLERA